MSVYPKTQSAVNLGQARIGAPVRCLCRHLWLALCSTTSLAPGSGALPGLPSLGTTPPILPCSCWLCPSWIAIWDPSIQQMPRTALSERPRKGVANGLQPHPPTQGPAALGWESAGNHHAVRLGAGCTQTQLHVGRRAELRCPRRVARRSQLRTEQEGRGGLWEVSSANREVRWRSERQTQCR